MAAHLEHSLLLLPVPDMKKTANYYKKNLEFTIVAYLNSESPHICLYRDSVEIVLLQSKLQQIQPNRILHGTGYDGYFTGKNIKPFYEECVKNNVKIVKPLAMTDYGNLEFVLEDNDERWICIGVKQKVKQ